MPDILPDGTHVQFGAKRTGTIVRYAKSARHPWKVYYVRPDQGYGNQVILPNGESIMVVEVHPDRILTPRP